MLERAILREHFMEIHRQVRCIAQEYERLARSAPAGDAREELRRLARGQSRHVELTERLVEIVSE